MQKAISYRDATGALYDIPEEEAEAFKREMPQARPVRTFRDATGAMYDVPEEEAEAFRTDMPQAEPVRMVRAAGGDDGGAVFEVPDSERETFLQGYRSEPEFEADREAARATVEAAAAAAPEGRGGVGAGEAVARGLADAGVTITKGIAGVPQLAAGLADLAIEANPATHVQRAVYGGRYPKGGMAGRALERVAPLAATQAALQEQYSDEQQKAFGEVSGADGSGLAGRMERAGVPGFMARPVGKAVAMAGKLAQHPTVIAHQALESLPAMGVGGMIGRGVAPALRAAGMAPAAAAMAGGAVGEGAAAAGSLQEQIRAATPGGATTPGQTLAAVAAGVGTAGFGMLSGRIGRKLGLEAADIDTLLAGGTTPKIQRSVLGRIAAGALQEGLLEELPQSANEKILENLATGRPWSEGVIEAGVTGAAVGGVMGAGANLGARGRGTGETLNAQRATLNAQGGTGETLNAQGATRNAQGGMGDGGLPTPNALTELPAAPGLTREVQEAVPILDRRPLGAGIFTEPPAAPVGPTVAAAEAMRVNREVEAGWQAAQARREQAKLDRKQETVDKRAAARQPGAESGAAPPPVPMDATPAVAPPPPPPMAPVARDTREAQREAAVQPEARADAAELDARRVDAANAAMQGNDAVLSIAAADAERAYREAIIPKDSEFHVRSIKMEERLRALARAQQQDGYAQGSAAAVETVKAAGAVDSEQAAEPATQVAEKGAAQPEPGPPALALEGQTQEQMDAEAQARTAEEQRREMLARAAAPIEGNAGDTTAVIPGMEGEVAPNLFDAAEVEARRALGMEEAGAAVDPAAAPVVKESLTPGRGTAAGMADVAGDAAPGSMAPVVRTADDPQFSIMPVELPEAVDFARQALGRFPRVKAVIRALHGTALGVYKRSAQGPVGIELKRSIFNLLQESDYRQATEDAEAWAAANWREQPGGPTRDAAVQAWRNARLEEVAELRLGENPKEASNVLWHEIGHWIDDVPNWMLEKRGNILGHIATLNTYTKQMLSRVPPNDEAAIPAAKERAKLRAQAEREAGKRPGKNDAEGLKAWRAGVNGRYGELVEAAAAERGLVTRKALLAELNGLIAWWHGTESIPDYFTKPSEMYADAFSVLVNNPAAVRERAPGYYALWQAWLGEKPAAQELWNRYQMDAVLGRVGDMRDRRQIEGIAEASAHREKQLRAKLVLSAQQSRDAILGMVYSGSYSIRRRVDLAKRRGRLSVTERMQKALQDDIYQHSWAMGYMMEVQDKVGRRVFVDAGVPMAEWQVFLQNRQIAENRKGIASMYGMNPAAANEALARQRERIGEARYGAMLEAQAQWHELRKRYVIGVALEKGLINAELAELMEDRAAYSHVAAVDVDVDPVQAVFRAAYGAEVGARIHKQEGFLGLAADPWQATLELDRNLIAAAHKNELKNALAAMLADADEELYQPAGERFDVGLKRNVPVTGEGVRASTLVAMRDGKPWSFWAPQEVVDFVDSADSMSGGVMTRLINTLLRKLKGIYTWMNYGFSIFNTPRDIQDWIRNLPGWKGRRTYNKYQALAAPVVKSIVDGRPTEQAAEILRANILLYFPQGMKPGDNRLLQQIGEKVGGRVGRALEAVGPQTAMERMVAAYDLRPDWMGLDVSGRKKVLEGIKRWYMKPNTRGEMTRKVAAWLYLKDKYPDMTDAERQRMVQMYGGSPDFANTPKKNPVIDAVLPFYNPFLRGWESGLKAFSEEPVRVTLTTMRYGVIPKLMLAAIGTGMLRDLLKRMLGDQGEWYGEELRKMTQFIPQYYKDNYAVHPIWWDPTDPTHTKVIFETSPLSENNRFASALIWKMLSKEDVASLFDFGADQLPGLNPILTLGYQWNQVLRGQAPKGIGITETQIDAGAAMSPMLRETFNQLSGGMLGRIPREGIGDVNLSPLEKLLRAPIVSNTIGRRIRVSNRGWQEGLTKQAAHKYGKERDVARQEAWNAALEYGRSGALPAEAAVRQANGAMWMAARPAGMEPTAYMLTIDKNDGLDAYFAERLNDYMLEVNLQQAGPVQRAIQRAPWTERMEMIRGYGK